jgi:uncharacterized protein (DUF433 family)
MHMELPDFLHNTDDEIRLKGHRIRLIDVAARYDEGHSAETIVLDHYPTLPLALVYKTVAFYLENQSTVRELIDRNAAEIERQAALPQATPTLAELRRRMDALRRAEAS